MCVLKKKAVEKEWVLSSKIFQHGMYVCYIHPGVDFSLIACRRTVATCQLAAGSESCTLGGGSSKGNGASLLSCWRSQQTPEGFHTF